MTSGTTHAMALTRVFDAPPEQCLDKLAAALA
jgi:hypothetical protein